jgi:hypothetical protein
MASKIQERMYVEWFLGKTGRAYHGVQEADPPDFILFIDDRRIALEVTRLFIEPNPGRKGSISKRDESHRAQWLKSLADRYYGQTDVPIRVQVCLPGLASLDEDSSAEVLSSLLKSNELAEWEQRRYELDLAPGTVKLFVRRLPPGDRFARYSRWGCQNDQMGWAEPLSLDHIGNAVRKKEASLPKYRADYDEAWLLLVVDGSRRSGMLNVPKATPQLKESEFDSVWLVEYLEGVQKLTG